MTKEWVKEYALLFDGKRNYFHNGFRLFVSNAQTEFSVGDHKHIEYEFMYLKNDNITTFCNGKDCIIKKGHFFPFNSFDTHGQGTSAVVNGFICILISPALIEEIFLKILNFEKTPVFINKSFLPSTNLNFYLGAFINEFSNNDKNNELYLDSLIKLIIIEIVRCSYNNITITKETHAIILRTKAFINDNCDLPFNLQQVAEVANLSKHYFLKLFASQTGMTPQQYYEKTKTNHAKTMIALGTKTLTEIAYELGYSSQSYFSAQFKKHTGITPSAYKKTLI